MPLVRLIGDAINQALTECLGIPAGDQFRIIGEHRPGRLRYDSVYLDVERTVPLVAIDVTLSTGRTIKQRRA